MAGLVTLILIFQVIIPGVFRIQISTVPSAETMVMVIVSFPATIILRDNWEMTFQILLRMHLNLLNRAVRATAKLSKAAQAAATLNRAEPHRYLKDV